MLYVPWKDDNWPEKLGKIKRLTVPFMRSNAARKVAGFGQSTYPCVTYPL